MTEEEGEEGNINLDEFKEEINNRLDNYFSENKNVLLSYGDLEDFLKAIELYEYWNTEDDKDAIWQKLKKYSKDDKVDSEGIKKGMHDFINFLQNGDEENENDGYLLSNIDNNDIKKERKESKDENLLTRISRISIRNDGVRTNKLVLNKYKQKAIDEYECLDNDTLIQFKRIFMLLNIDENNKNIIPIETIDQLINKHKFIKLEKNEIIRYIHYLSCDDKSIYDITSININNTIYSEIDSLIENRLIEEGLDINKIVEEEEEEEEIKDKDKDEDPLDILDDILKKVEETKENSLLLKNMQNNIIKSNQNYTEKVTKFFKENIDESQNEIINNIQKLGICTVEDMQKFDEFLSTLTKDQKTNIKKINSLKKNILLLNKEISKLKDDYNYIYEKYNNNQQLDMDEEMERLCDENMTLDNELKLKKKEISELINEKAEKDKEINNLYIKIDSHENNEKELKNQVRELKLSVDKLKKEYNDLIDSTLDKMEKKEKEEKKERERIKEMIEKQLKNEEEKGGNKSPNDKLDILALSEIDSMNISLTDKLLKKKKILSQLNFEQLMEYTLKLERLNINLKSEKEKKEQKIKELEEKLNQSNKTIISNKKEIGELNIEIKKLNNSIINLQSEIKTNENFRPSIAYNNQTLVSRMSKLNTEGLNNLKFKQLQIVIIKIITVMNISKIMV